MQDRILQSTAFTWAFKLYLTDHITPATGKTVAITLSKNTAGLAAFGNPSAGASVATEVGNGWYYFVSSTTDTGTLGPVIWLGTATGCDNADQAYDVVKATNAGLTSLPDTAVTTNASLLTSGVGTDQLSVATGRVDIGKILGTTSVGAVGYVGVDWGQVTNKTTTNALTGTTIASTQQVDVNTIKAQAVTCAAGVTVNINVGTTQPVNFTGTAGSALVKSDMVDIAGTASVGTAGYVGVDWGQITNKTTTNALTGTTISSTQIVASVSGAVGSVTGLTTATIATAIWTDTTAGDFTTLTSPGKIIFAQLGGTFTTTSSSVFSTAALANAGGSTPAAIATAVWQDTTAGDFTTSGSIGKSLFTSGNAPGAASGLALVGSNMGTVTSVSGAVGSVTGLTNATIATAVWTDTTGSDFTVLTSPGAIIFTQLGGSFTTTSSSIFSTAALANAPSGGGGSPSAIWQDLLAGGDFATPGSIGELLANQIPNLDVAVSTRSTYGGGDTTGTTTLLGLLTPTRAGYLDNLSGGAVALASGVTVTVNSDKTGYSLNLGQTLNAARDLTVITDTALTLNDVFQAAAASTSGQEDVPGNLTYLTKTSAGTLLRTFSIDSNTTPTYRH